jgi:hypothetical protein
MNQRKSFRVILAENNALQRLYDFEQAHPDINIYGSKFSYQEQDENGHYLTDTSVRISFDAMFCRSINEVFVAAETYVWLRDKLNERGMYGCLPGKVHYKDSQANGEFTYGIHAYEKSIRISWREHDKQEWKYKTCKTKEDVIDFIDKFEKEFTEKSARIATKASAEIKRDQAKLTETLTGVKPVECQTKDQLFAIENRFDDIKTIGLYLALNPEHKASYMFAPIMRHELTYDYNKGFCLQAFLNGEAVTEPHHHKVMLDEFASVIKWAKETEPSDKYKDTFKTKWDEIKAVTELNMNFNRDKKGRN